MNPAEQFLRVVRPCADCPFVVANNFPLDASRRREIARGLRQGGSFSCHKTVDDSEEEPDVNGSSRCVGAASVAYKSGVISQVEQIAYRLGLANHNTKVLERDDTFSSLEDFEKGPTQ